MTAGKVEMADDKVEMTAGNVEMADDKVEMIAGKVEMADDKVEMTAVGSNMAPTVLSCGVKGCKFVTQELLPAVAIQLLAFYEENVHTQHAQLQPMQHAVGQALEGAKAVNYEAESKSPDASQVVPPLPQQEEKARSEGVKAVNSEAESKTPVMAPHHVLQYEDPYRGKESSSMVSHQVQHEEDPYRREEIPMVLHQVRHQKDPYKGEEGILSCKSCSHKTVYSRPSKAKKRLARHAHKAYRRVTHNDKKTFQQPLKQLPVTQQGSRSGCHSAISR